MPASKKDEGSRPNGKLSIPLPFEEAIRAALEVRPPPKPPRKKQPKKGATRAKPE